MFSVPIRRISFPVFGIGVSAKLSKVGGKLFATTVRGTQLIDDTTVKEVRLGSRRLRTRDKTPLYKLTRSCASLRDIIILRKTKLIHTFVDFKGVLFRADASKSYNITRHKIEDREVKEGTTEVILKLEGLIKPLLVDVVPKQHEYAEIIHYEHGYIVLETSEEIGKRQRLKL